MSSIPEVPPARIAQTVGRGHIPDWNPGQVSVREGPGAVIPVLRRAMDSQAPTMVEGINIPLPKDMDAGTAAAHLAKMISDMKRWLEAYPYEAQGEAAYVLGVFRGLQARHAARLDARAYAQPVEADAIDAAQHVPPPELFLLREVAGQGLALADMYQRRLKAADVALSEPDRAAIDKILIRLTAVLPNA